MHKQVLEAHLREGGTGAETAEGRRSPPREKPGEADARRRRPDNNPCVRKRLVYSRSEDKASEDNSQGRNRDMTCRHSGEGEGGASWEGGTEVHTPPCKSELEGAAV